MTTPVPTLKQNDHPTPALSRRTVIAGAAWSVPVIVAVTATPAFAAASQTSVVTATTPGMQTPASGQVTVTAVVKNSSGAPLPGKAVSFTGPDGTSFTPTTATTDGSGTATSTLTTTDAWALPGSSVTVTALSNGASGTAPLTVLGANAYSYGDNGSNAAPSGSSTSTPVQLQQAFPSPIVAIANSVSDDQMGSRAPFTLALLKDGTVWAVGTNIQGQMGDGTTTDRTTWAKVPGLSGVTEVATQSGAAYALLSDGTIRSWGSNEVGQLGDGSSVASSSTPVTVTGISTAVHLASGLALLSDGSIRAWGYGYGGRLGNGTTTDSSTPVTVTGITNAVQISSGSSSAYAILSDGTIRSWGFNGNGELGNGTTTDSSTPVTVTGITNATQVAGGNASAYALLADGTIRCWGWNGYGELGDGTTATPRTNPSSVAGISSAAAITAIYTGGYALLTDGTLKAWGQGPGASGAVPTTITGTQNVTVLANNAFATTATAYFIVGDRVVALPSSNPTTISAGSTAALTASVASNVDGAALVGQTVTFTAGDATNFTPADATTASDGSASTTLASTDPWATPGSTLTVTASSGGYRATKALTVLGANAFGVGDNQQGRTGTGSSDSVVGAPTQLLCSFPAPITAMASGEAFSLALLSDGTVWAVGQNGSGQLGNGTTTDRSTWAPVPGISNATGIAVANRTSIAVLASGAVMQWGRDLNRSGNNLLSPTQVNGLSNAVQVAAAGSTFYAVRDDGSLSSWGSGDNWLLGDGTRNYRATPSAVPNITTAVEVAGTFETALVRLSTGEIYAWGSASNGALGNGTQSTTDSDGSISVPSQKDPQPVTGITTAKKLVTGGSSVYALLTSGEIRSWGWNDSGQLGDGTTTDRATPVSVSGITNAVTIGGGYNSAYAILTDGTSRAWGDNSNGQLGDPNIASTATPTTLDLGRPLKAFTIRPTWTTMHFITA